MTIFILKPGGTLLLMEKKNDLIWKNYFYLGFLSLSLPEFLTLSLSGTLGLSNFSLKSLLSKRKEALYLDPVF